MTELTDQQNDAMEHAEHSAHAAEHGDPLTLKVTLSIAIMAVVAAFIGALGEVEASHTFVEKNDAVLAQAKASDAWANYQADSIKKHIYDLGSMLAAGPDAVKKFQDLSDKFAREQTDVQTTARGHEAEVEARSVEAETHFGRHHILTIAEGIEHVAIAGASIALLARRKSFWFGSLFLTGAGIIVAAVSYAL